MPLAVSMPKPTTYINTAVSSLTGGADCSILVPVMLLRPGVVQMTCSGFAQPQTCLPASYSSTQSAVFLLAGRIAWC